MFFTSPTLWLSSPRLLESLGVTFVIVVWILCCSGDDDQILSIWNYSIINHIYCWPVFLLHFCIHSSERWQIRAILDHFRSITALTGLKIHAVYRIIITDIFCAAKSSDVYKKDGRWGRARKVLCCKQKRELKIHMKILQCTYTNLSAKLRSREPKQSPVQFILSLLHPIRPL